MRCLNRKFRHPLLVGLGAVAGVTNFTYPLRNSFGDFPVTQIHSKPKKRSIGTKRVAIQLEEVYMHHKCIKTKMAPELKTAISNLYATFSHYPFRPEIDGCPCCITAQDQQKLSAKALHLMESEDISRYSWKAMTTWGNVEDFKHFLPRLLELSATTGLAYGHEVVLGKLKYAKWNDWEETEKDAIRAFLMAWWTELVTKKETWGFLELRDLYPFFGKVDPFLKSWSIDINGHSFRNMIRFIRMNYLEILEKKSYFKEFDPASINKLLNWIMEKKELLEQGFYLFETTDPEFAKEISDALCLLDWVPWPESK